MQSIGENDWEIRHRSGARLLHHLDHMGCVVVSGSGWSSRAQSRASLAQQFPYRLLTISGFILLFAVRTNRYRGPLRIWTLPISAGWAMVLLCAMGFGFAWWARLHLGQLWSAFVTSKADHRIVDTGPYRIVRHPIYTGIIPAAIALALVKGTVIALAGALLAAFGFWVKARLEEGFLREQLGAEAYDCLSPPRADACAIRPS